VTQELLLFMHPLREPEQNHRLEQLMQTRNLRARGGYLADKGRTRIIAIVIADDEIVDLCMEVLASVVTLRPGDELTCVVAWGSSAVPSVPFELQ
jgi:hypothetical protein